MSNLPIRINSAPPSPIKFLGATVLSFNSSIGWGSTASTLSVDLIEDCNANPPDCFEINNNCTPGVPPVTVGKAAYFAAGNFTFNGIIQSYSRSRSSSGLIYKVQLTDPRDLLQNFTLIVDTYQGAPVGVTNNFLNVYNYWEKEQCFNGSFGFGAGGVGNQGMSVGVIGEALANLDPVIVSSPTGENFSIDLSALNIFNYPFFYRIAGPKVTLLELIQNICDTYGHDFYVYLDKNNINGGVIRLGLVDLKISPNLDSVENFVTNQGNDVIDSSIGRELRNDITKTLIIGEKRHNLYYSNQFNPFFGEEYNSTTGRMDPIIPYHYEGVTGNGFWINKDVSSIGISSLSGKQSISELDIRFAMSGFKAWYNWVFFHYAPGGFNDTLRSVFSLAKSNENFKKIIEDLQLAQAPVNNVDPAQGAARANRGQDNFTKAREMVNKDSILLQLEIVHSWLASLGNTYYGKQYLAVIPNGVCSVVGAGENLETAGIHKFSAEPTNAGGWWEGTSSPLNISNNGLNLFKSDDGRVTGFARFSPSENNFAESLSIENLSDDDYIIENNNLYVKFDLEEKMYPYFAPGSTGVAIPYVLIKFGNMVVQNPSESLDEDKFPRGLLWSYACNHNNYLYTPNHLGTTTIVNRLHSKTIPIFKPSVVTGLVNNKGAWGASSLNDRGFVAAAANPVDCVIPMKSNIFTYGPWGSINFKGLPQNCGTDNNGTLGGTEVISDPDMAPWNFGNIATMNSAGCELANSSNIGLTQAESGSFTLVGLPSLGVLGNALIANGASLTGVNTTFGSGGVTTSYEFKTFTPKFGKLSKLFSDRLKQQAKQRMQNLKFIRSQMGETNRLNKKISQINNAILKNNTLGSDARKASPANILTGKVSDWYNLGDTKSQVVDVGLENTASAINEMTYDYDKKAFVSLDAVFSPVSIKGAGDLPQYINISPLDEANRLHKSSPIYAQPPFYKKEEESENKNHDLYNLHIKNLYLNPLSNPNQIPHVSNSQHKGHSIDVVGRESQLPDKGLMSSFYSSEDANKYSNDYRFLGMRGPIVLQSWGYDIDGKPIPNAVDKDEDSSKGIFTNEKLKDEFLKDWLQKSKTWPVGPIDLRFDRERGVWVSPQPHKIVVAKLIEDLKEFQSVKAKIINSYNNKEYSGKLYDKEGEEVKAGEDDSEAYINVVDRVGKTFNKDSLVYVYYDAYLSEYIILAGESSNETIIRFKLIEPCDVITPTYGEGDEWVEYAGYGDKRYGKDAVPDSYAVRINCDGQPIKKDGTLLSDSELSNMADNGEHLIIVKDSIGEWGPSFNSIKDITKWKERAACGYGVLVTDPKPSGVEDSSSGEEPQCLTNLSCEITYTNEDNETVNIDKIYEILYLESYARIIYGELTQDLYPSEEKVSAEYSQDQWKVDNPKGNASIRVDKFFGNADNGQKPIYLDRTEEEIEVRVFDPFFDPDRLDDSPFSELVEGSRVIAIFNETLKKYEIIQADKKESSPIIRFKVFEFCEASSDYNHEDPWQQYAGYGDKLPNNHILGIRINCDNQPINKQGEVITNEEINNALNSGEGEDVFINLYDTCGQHGPAFAFYRNFNEWNRDAFTGFAAKIISASGDPTSCQGMGVSDQCSVPKDNYEKYDIIFLESYARFVECTLTQDLYPSEEKASTYNNDSYKNEYPQGNASAEIIEFYGGSPNHKMPKFYDNSISDVPFRVFDPYQDVAKNRNPFGSLKEGDKVVAVFNEKLKKYIILSSSSNKENSRIVKFALVYNKKSSDATATAVMINDSGMPIDSSGELLTEDNFQANFITVQDPYINRAADVYGTSMSYSSGPAIGSDIFEEHIEGISDLEHNGKKFGPFIGFAVETTQPSGSSQGSESDININQYEIIALERFAQYVTGIIGVKKSENDYYYGAMTSYWDGRHPLSRSTKDLHEKGLNLKLKYNISPINGEHSFIVGDFKEGQTASPSEPFESLASKVDGCKFVAKLSDIESFNSEEELIYHIVESEHVALFGSSVIKKQNLAEELNFGAEITEDDTNEKIQSSYTNGFQWSRQESKTNYNSIKINNRNDWINKGYLVKNSNLYTKLQDLSETGPIYTILDGGTIAKVAEKRASDGKWGTGQSSGENSYKADNFYQGVSPQSIDEEDGGQPQLDAVTFGAAWMSYEGSPTISLWDESNPTVAGQKNYRVIYVREAPVIITGKCVKKFTPSDTEKIQVSVSSSAFASCPKVNNSPIPTLLTKVKNPMGYGAQEDDYVTLQRVFSTTIQEDLANYYYIVIGTGGGKPETC
jgi:hypothetical protein